MWLLHCDAKDWFDDHIPSVFVIEIYLDKCSKWSWMEELNKCFYKDIDMLALFKNLQLLKNVI